VPDKEISLLHLQLKLVFTAIKMHKCV